jgi:hypothetical protein
MISYTDQLTLLDNATFRARVRQSAIRAAHALLGDPGQSAKHSGCRFMIRDPGMCAERLAPGVAVQLDSATPDDAEINSCVDGILDRYFP